MIRKQTAKQAGRVAGRQSAYLGRAAISRASTRRRAASSSASTRSRTYSLTCAAPHTLSASSVTLLQ